MQHSDAASPSLPFLRENLLGGMCLILLGACSSGASPAEVQLKLELKRADSCSGLLERVREGLVEVTAERADEFRRQQGPAAAVSRTSPGGSLAPPPPGTDVAGGAGGGFSSNPVQPDGVEVPDIVQTDGDQIYVLHAGSLLVLRGWPANETALLGSASIEGQPLEMFVRSGKAAVFSSVNGGFGADASGDAAPNGADDGFSYTKLTVFDVTGDTPAVLRESYLEGTYVSSRRDDGLVRAVIHYDFRAPNLHPELPNTDASGQVISAAQFDAEVVSWRDRSIQSLQNAQLTDLLPREVTRQGSRLALEAPRCSDYHASDSGFNTAELTSVVSFDLDDVSATFGGAAILGNASVYANAAALLVTQRDLTDPAKIDQSIIHRFDISGPSTSYVASGAVPGTIFSPLGLDEKDGVIRVAMKHTTDSVERVMTLETHGESLVPSGVLRADGAMGTEFIGDRGYFPTSADEFSIVDLTDPTSPHLAGTLTIPGSNGYLLPLDETHLLAIGRDETPYRQLQDAALMIVDLSHPTSPAWTYRYLFTDPGAETTSIDQGGIKFDSTGGVLAFPYRKQLSGESSLEVMSVSPQSGFTHLGAVGLPIDWDTCLADQGLSAAEIADIESDASFPEIYASSCPSPELFTRSLFRDGFVYAISDKNIYAYSLSSMDVGPVQQARLPAPASN